MGLSNHKALETTGMITLVLLILNIFLENKFIYYVVIILIFVGLFLTKISIFISRAWLKFSELLGTVSTSIILFLVFFFILTPIAYLYRIFHKDLIVIHHRDSAQESYWLSRNYSYKASDLEKMW